MDIKYGTQVPVEPFLVPTWHMSVPDELIIDNTSYSMDYLVKKGTNIIFTQGLDTIINAMSISSAGEVSTFSTMQDVNKIFSQKKATDSRTDFMSI